MIIYISIFLFLFLYANQLIKSKKFDKFIYPLFVFFLIIFIGLRDGLTDYFLYLKMFNEFKSKTLSEINFQNLTSSYAYDLLSWGLGRLKIGYTGIMLINAILTVYVIDRFGEYIKNKWICFLMFYPIGILVMSMGYVRQSYAFYIVILALLNLINQKNYYFYFQIILATLFHKSAIIFLPLHFIISEKKNYYLILFLFFITLVFVYVERYSLYRLFKLYLGHDMDVSIMNSMGVYLKFSINIIASIIFCFFRDKIFSNNIEYKICLVLLFGNFFFLCFAIISTTFADRMLLYFMAFQFFVFGNACKTISQNFKTKVVLFISLIYAGYFLIWIFFANTKHAWIPYKNILF